MQILIHALARVQAALLPRPPDERGDVPGWVMITVMTAGLVAALTAVAGPQLQAMLTSALGQVK